MYFDRIGQLLLVVFFTMPLVTVQAANHYSVHQKLAALEASSGGRLGISSIDTTNDQRIQYHADQRFPIGSTFKVLGVAATLKRSMQDAQLLQQTMMINKQDLTSWGPVTQKHLDQAMSIFDLSAAAIMYSDNAAIFLLIKKLGGPQEVISFAHSIGDDTFSMNATLDNLSPTSTPAAMNKTLQKLALGNVLGIPQREQLITWMKNNTTGNLRIRAGVPKSKGWVVADKTGSGHYGLTGDIAIIWPPNHHPIVVTIYFIQKGKNAKSRPLIVAEATRILMNEFESRKQ